MILVVDTLLAAPALAFVHRVVAGARFADGGASAGGAARSAKRNLELDRAATPGAGELEALVAGALRGHPEVQAAVLPAAFSRPILNRYDDGMEYGWHVDNPLMGAEALMRTDVSCTLFLSDPDTYDGGELVIEVEGEPRAIKPAAGSAVLYTTGLRHRVAPVTRGTRLAAVAWMQSIVADPGQRAILSTFHRLHARMAATAPDSADTQLMLEGYYALLRLWARV